MDYEQWLKLVDSWIYSLSGGEKNGHEDFPDFNWEDAYDSSIVAKEAATVVLEDDGYVPVE